MANELAYVLINPYTIAKSRTGGVLGRFLSRTGLEIVAARMFAPPSELANEYAALIRSSDGLEPAARALLADYVLKTYVPDPITGRAHRVLMILLEGEDAIQKVRDVAGPVIMGSGETVRDTYGDYVVDERKQVQYFEPAVLVGANHAETAATLKLWARYVANGGLIKEAAEIVKQEGWQRTLVLIKPDNFRFPNARPGNIIDLLSRSGLRIIAAKVHCMSVVQAEEFYGPVRQVLRQKMKAQVVEKATKALETEFDIEIPQTIKDMLAENIGPLFGDEQFNQIIKFMTGYYPPTCTAEERAGDGRSKCLALVYSGVGAVEKIRKLLGPTDPSKAQPGSVRREFGHDVMINAAHASDSSENADREIGIVKPEEDRITPCVKKYYGG